MTDSLTKWALRITRLAWRGEEADRQVWPRFVGPVEKPPETGHCAAQIDNYARLVIPAKAGIQAVLEVSGERKLDPSFRWGDDDESKASTGLFQHSTVIAVREADKARVQSTSCGRTWILPCLALLTIVLTGCSPYSFTGGGKAIVPSVAVRLFDNETEQFGIAEKLTEGLVDGFVEDNHVKVLDATRAKSILEGTIKEYGRTSYTFDESDRVTEYIVEITVSMRLADAEPDGKVHWETEATRGFGVYNADTESETDGQDRAIEKITEDALNRTIKSW